MLFLQPCHSNNSSGLSEQRQTNPSGGCSGAVMTRCDVRFCLPSCRVVCFCVHLCAVQLQPVCTPPNSPTHLKNIISSVGLLLFSMLIYISKHAHDTLDFGCFSTVQELLQNNSRIQSKRRNEVYTEQTVFSILYP